MVLVSKRLIAIAATVALIVLPWLALFAAWLTLNPDVAEWTMMVAAAAVMTEVGLYLGAVALGVSVFRRIRNRLRFRRAKDEDNGAADASLEERR